MCMAWAGPGQTYILVMQMTTVHVTRRTTAAAAKGCPLLPALLDWFAWHTKFQFETQSWRPSTLTVEKEPWEEGPL